MPSTPVVAWGLFEMDYVAYTVPHVFRMWTREFDTTPGVGTFAVAGVPASLDAMATELSGILKTLYNSASALSFGAWRGNRVTTTEGGHVPVVTGVVTPDTAPAYNANPNAPEAVSQMTATFRDASGKHAKYVLIGPTYAGWRPFVYSGIAGGYLVLADYILNSIRVVQRNGNPSAAMVHMTFDTNDGLTRSLRR